MWRRMYTLGVPDWLAGAGKANLSRAAGATYRYRGEPLQDLPQSPRPIKFITESLRSNDFALFIYPGSGHDIVRVPSACAVEALERAEESMIYRFMDLYPRGMLDGIEWPEFNGTKFDRFAFCLREKVFDPWLAGLSRRLHWPLDVKRHSHRGQPALDFLIRPVVQDLIETGRWKQGMPLTSLVASVRFKIGKKVDRETVKKTMDRIYNETGNLAYRYVRRQRRTATARRAPPG